MTTSRLLTAALLLFVGGSAAQTALVVDFPPLQARTTPAMTASVVAIDAAKSETTLSVSCAQSPHNGTTTARFFFGCQPFTYRTSPGGFGVEAAITRLYESPGNGTQTSTSANLTLVQSVECPKPTNSAAELVCESTGLYIKTNGVDLTDTATKQVTYSTVALVTIEVTAGLPAPTSSSSSSSSTGGAALPMRTQNAMLAGALAVIGGAMMI